MNHLEHSFFICNKPVQTGLPGFTCRQAGDFYLGDYQDHFIAGRSADGLRISLEAADGIPAATFLQNTITVWQNTLTVTGSDMNTQAVYYITDKEKGRIAVFNDLFLAHVLLESMDMPVIYNYESYSGDLSFFKNVKRLKYGQQLTVTIRNNAMEVHTAKFSDLLNNRDEQYKDIHTAENEFYNCLNGAVYNGVKNIPEVNIALSGGVDSGTIACLIHQHGVKLKAYTVSTDWGDEYEAASETANFLGIELEVVHMSKDEIMQEVPNVIRFFSFVLPESIEIALVAHCLYRKLYERSHANRIFLTGYGSDLLNAGVYTPFSSYSELHTDCLRRLRSTQLSNEFSNLSALAHGVQVYHPFWQSEVINCALRVPPDYKVINGQDKYYFREMMKGRLPDNTVWRKKLGAHHGTGLSQHLHNSYPNGFEQTIKKIHEEIFYHGKYDYARQINPAGEPAMQAG